MRPKMPWLGLSLLFATSLASAQTKPLKVCVFQESEGYDAIRLAQQLTSRKLSDGASLAVVAITGKLLDAEWEHHLAAPEMPFTRVLFTDQTAKGRTAESGRLGCD
jgi:hypothetical protein